MKSLCAHSLPDTVRKASHHALRWYSRHFPASRGKQRIVSRFWRAATTPPYRRDCVLKQAPVRVRCDITQYVQRQLYFFGGYEPEQCDFWIHRSRSARVIVDGGANVGLYALLAAATNPAADVHAFEPSPDVFDAFQTNLALNQFANIVPNRLALGSSTGTACLHRCSGASGDNEGMDFVSTDGRGASEQISVVSLDDYCAANQIDRIDLLKLDLEGAEYDALLGCRRLLARGGIGCVLLESIDWSANRSGHATSDVHAYLAQFGYALHRLIRGRPVVLANRMYNGEIVALPTRTAAVGASE